MVCGYPTQNETYSFNVYHLSLMFPNDKQLHLVFFFPEAILLDALARLKIFPVLEVSMRLKVMVYH